MDGSAPQTVRIGGRTLRLTNPDRVMYPATGTTKAEVISYYVAVAELLLPHVTGRILTRKRWVDGVGTTDSPGEVFFEKNLPDSAPDWIRRVPITHSSRQAVYPVISDVAGLAWLGQVAALELHVPQWRVDTDDQPLPPDRLVLDLDPGEGVGLSACVEVAQAARELLAGIGLETHPVTSGSKGIHLYARLDQTHDADWANRFAQQIAFALSAELPQLVVSTQRKADRVGKVLVDWSQNHRGKTTVAPYSLRGTMLPMVAAPRTWAELDEPGLAHLRLEEVLERLSEADPMADLGATGPADDRLQTYRSMRDPAATPEPVPDRTRTGGTEPIFVIQEHHASRLHWDVRLERDGVLASWAVPKGPPDDPGQNHLAVQTEDHPLEYATFSGTIPAGQYGAGTMTIWDHGTYACQKWRDDEVIVTLHGSPDGGLGGAPVTFVLIRTEQNWLMHRRKQPTDTQHGFIRPMLASPGHTVDVADPATWAFEMKWDGVRAIAVADHGSVTLFSRAGHDITASYPEIVEALAGLDLDRAVLDGEIVSLDAEGRPDFTLVQDRIGLHRSREVQLAQQTAPATMLAFDLLSWGGQSLIAHPWHRRRALLEALDLSGTVRVPPTLEGDLAGAIAQSRDRGLEGVMAKQRAARYRPGHRTGQWLKFKNQRMQTVVIGGWRPGQGGRSDTFGSLLVGIPTDGGLRYVGRVGTGFRETDLDRIAQLMSRRRRGTTPFVDVPPEVARQAHWVTPNLVGEVSFSNWTRSGLLRHPTWRGLRADQDPAEVARED